MQNYYGLAIRNNIGNLYAMKKAILSTLFHFTDLPDPFDCHKFCPRDAGSWCKYWSKENKSYRSLNSIPMWIKNLIFPTFKALMEDELLEKCMHGKTQNANEALNAIIWSRVPKSTFVGRETIEMGTYSAVIHFNNGRNGILGILEYFGLTGIVLHQIPKKLDISREKCMTKKATDNVKKRRKSIRAKQKGYCDILKEKEPIDSYATGNY